MCIASSITYVWLCPHWWRRRLFVVVTMGVDCFVCPAWCDLNMSWYSYKQMCDCCFMRIMIISVLKLAGFIVWVKRMLCINHCKRTSWFLFEIRWGILYGDDLSWRNIRLRTVELIIVNWLRQVCHTDKDDTVMVRCLDQFSFHSY